MNPEFKHWLEQQKYGRVWSSELGVGSWGWGKGFGVWVWSWEELIEYHESRI